MKSLLMVSEYNKLGVHIYIRAYGLEPRQTLRKCSGVAEQGKREDPDLLIFPDFPPINPITIYQANASL